MRIRPLTAADVHDRSATLAALYSTIPDAAVTVDQLHARLGAHPQWPQHSLVAVDEADQIIGLCLSWERAPEPASEATGHTLLYPTWSVYCGGLAVAPDRRRQGIGRSLLQQWIDRSSAAGWSAPGAHGPIAHSLQTASRPANAAVVQLYRSLGFVPAGGKDYPGPPARQDVAMWRGPRPTGAFRPRALLCDWDGTLAETDALWDEFREMFFDAVGISAAELAQARTTPGASAVAVFARLTENGVLDQARSQRLLRLFLSAQVGWAKLFAIELRAGAAEVLEQAARAGVPVAVVTAGPRAVVQLQMQQTGLEALPLVAVEDVTPSKPAPDPYVHAANLLGVNIAGCVIVEDSPLGLQAAHATTAQVVCVAGRDVQAELAAAHISLEP